MSACAHPSAPPSPSSISIASTAASTASSVVSAGDDIVQGVAAVDAEVCGDGRSITDSVDDNVLEVIGRGSGGVEEMARKLRNDEVLWAMLRFELGTGSFTRTKIVLVHFNADGCPPLKRSKMNALTNQIKERLRDGQESFGFQACLQFNNSAEVTVENVLRKARNFFVVDHVGDYSTAWVLRKYGEQISHEFSRGDRPEPHSLAASAAGWGGRRECSGTPEKIPPPRDRLVLYPGNRGFRRYHTGRDALRAVVGNGAWNWVLIGPDPKELPLLAGGSGCVDEMRTAALEVGSDTVTFGLLRLRFGAERLMREKFVFLHLIGPKTSVVKRGRCNTVTAAMAEAFKAFASASVSFFDLSPENLKLEDIIARVRSVSVVDDEVIEHDGARRSIFSLEAFRHARALEKAGEGVGNEGTPPRRRGPLRKPSGGGGGGDFDFDVNGGVERYDIANTVKLVSGVRACNWALFRPRLPRRETLVPCAPPQRTAAAAGAEPVAAQHFEPRPGASRAMCNLISKWEQASLAGMALEAH
mmetsp:Transcript_101144/g.291188  ORF Transcript_101144/g.291188 Transcript_101144/m.291188 type:complete len:529 (+) Transcript_101144:73-1659(+)